MNLTQNQILSQFRQGSNWTWRVRRQRFWFNPSLQIIIPTLPHHSSHHSTLSLITQSHNFIFMTHVKQLYAMAAAFLLKYTHILTAPHTHTCARTHRNCAWNTNMLTPPGSRLWCQSVIYRAERRQTAKHGKTGESSIIFLLSSTKDWKKKKATVRDLSNKAFEGTWWESCGLIIEPVWL